MTYFILWHDTKIDKKLGEYSSFYSSWGVKFTSSIQCRGYQSVEHFTSQPLLWQGKNCGIHSMVSK